MPEHAKFAPSGAHRWITCPGSIRLSENIESVASEYAMEGSALHKVTEHCLRDKLPAVDFIGMTLESPKDDPNWSMPMDEDHAEAVQYCVDEVKRLMGEYSIRGGRLEIRVYLTGDCWGTVDVLFWNAEWTIVIDFKFGRGKSVEAEGNSQLMIYYLAALKHLRNEGIPIPPKAKLVILQPRIPNPTREWDTTAKEVKTWYIKSVKPAFDEARKADAVCNPGEEQCQFCDANGVCVSRANYLLGSAEEEFKQYAVSDEEGKDLPMAPEVQSLAADIRDKMDTAIDTINPVIAAKILAYQPDFDNFFKAVGQYALTTALKGETIPGYKLVSGRSNRKWSKPDNEIEKILKANKVKDPFTKKILSPAQAEKKCGKGTLNDYIFKPTGKTILVDDTDTREAIDMSGESDMSEFTEESVTGNTEEVTVFEDDTSIDDILAGFEDDDDDELAGGVQQDAIAQKEVILTSNSTASPPSKRTKKYKLMEMGKKGGVNIQEAADVLFNGDRGQVVKGLRNLNERDGYTIIYHDDQHFTVRE